MMVSDHINWLEIIIIDKTIKPRYLRTYNKSQSLHYYHSYAVQDRINVFDLPIQRPLSCMPSPDLVAESLLPSSTDDAALVKNIKILFSRVLSETLKLFDVSFSDLIEVHIGHRRYREMSSKSHVVK